ncbi:MAG: hypothetical protein C4574_00595 [Candidatus Latescibacterota bacterium]|jgi:hypothetical protein|nr:MAG: hypothetical protein C4574_00595 [Candidatus Latescibacterota bacterium]
MKKKDKKTTELSALFFFLLGAIFGYLVSAPARYETDRTPSAADVTNTGTVIPDVTTIEAVGKIESIVRFVTNQSAVTQIVYVYRELSNFVTAAPVSTGQSLEVLTFDVYKNHYTLPLSFPRWQVGLSYDPFQNSLGVSVGYRIWDRISVMLGSDFKGLQIGLNVLID